MYDLNMLKSREFDVPVISIGNITAGGTGKTPHVEYLIDLLKEKFEVVTLSRGYKRKTKGFRIAEINSNVGEVGDEPLQMKRKFPEVTVAVSENRIRGIEKLLNIPGKKSPDVILLDDAFQHRRVIPGINILLIDYNRPLKQDSLLPAGRLRESISEMSRANIIIFTKCSPEKVTPIQKRIMQKDVRLKPYQKLFFTSFTYEDLKPVFAEGEPEIELSELNNHSILIVTGIAFPKLIPEYLKKYASETEIINFPDHYNFRNKDIELIMNRFTEINSENKIIVTTEKDAIRFAEMPDLEPQFKSALYYLPLKVSFLDKEEKMFNKDILNYVGKNKSNRELYRKKNTGQA